jgi:hypothetical protein
MSKDEDRYAELRLPEGASEEELAMILDAWNVRQHIIAKEDKEREHEHRR